MYHTVKEIAKKWEISTRRARVLCSESKILGAFKDGRSWKIPIDAIKPSEEDFLNPKAYCPSLMKNYRK